MRNFWGHFYNLCSPHTNSACTYTHTCTLGDDEVLAQVEELEATATRFGAGGISSVVDVARSPNTLIAVQALSLSVFNKVAQHSYVLKHFLHIFLSVDTILSVSTAETSKTS